MELCIECPHPLLKYITRLGDLEAIEWPLAESTKNTITSGTPKHSFILTLGSDGIHCHLQLKVPIIMIDNMVSDT